MYARIMYLYRKSSIISCAILSQVCTILVRSWGDNSYTKGPQKDLLMCLCKSLQTCDDAIAKRLLDLVYVWPDSMLTSLIIQVNINPSINSGVSFV